MIAIKGMTMPKSCGDCPMFHEGWEDVMPSERTLISDKAFEVIEE